MDRRWRPIWGAEKSTVAPRSVPKGVPTVGEFEATPELSLFGKSATLPPQVTLRGSDIGLKILFPATGVRVRVPPRVPVRSFRTPFAFVALPLLDMHFPLRRFGKLKHLAQRFSTSWRSVETRAYITTRFMQRLSSGFFRSFFHRCFQCRCPSFCAGRLAGDRAQADNRSIHRSASQSLCSVGNGPCL